MGHLLNGKGLSSWLWSTWIQSSFFSPFFNKLILYIYIYIRGKNVFNYKKKLYIGLSELNETTKYADVYHTIR